MYREDKAYMIRKLGDLSHSKFRSCFLLKEKEKQYVWEKGLDVIEKHARDFIVHRLAPAIILKDGKQTPMRGHPVFIAQHATATCCRKCLYQWHNIRPGAVLTLEEQDYVITLILTWIQAQIK